MISYPFNSIQLNQKDINLTSILSDSVSPQTDFEKDTLFFLKEWLQGTQEFVIQTSGSTGKPKNIIITREQMQQGALMTIQLLKLSPHDTSLVCLPTKYIAGKMMLVRAIVNNMKIVAVEPSSKPFEKIAPHLKIDFAAFVPLQFQALLDAGLVHRLNTIKNILIGGAAISQALRKRIITELHTKVFATYGMTETVTHIALQELNKETQENNFVSLPGVQLKLDERQCLVIEAAHLKEPVVTNDLVEITGPYSFKWLGRIDSVINSGGVKIIPEQVEASIDVILKDLNILRRFFIASAPDERLGEMVVLIIEGERLSVDEEEKIRANLKDALSAHAAPKEIRYIPKFLETETGKIKSKETLREQNNMPH